MRIAPHIHSISEPMPSSSMPSSSQIASLSPIFITSTLTNVSPVVPNKVNKQQFSCCQPSLAFWSILRTHWHFGLCLYVPFSLWHHTISHIPIKAPQLGLHIAQYYSEPEVIQNFRDKQWHFGFDVNAQIKPLWPPCLSTLQIVLGFTSFP
jgi:hypothetical protein